MILKQPLLEGKAVSDVCDAHGLNPNVFYRWQKEFFENGAAVFEKTDKRTEQVAQRRYAELEAKLAKKDTVIAQIMEDLIAEKNGGGGFERCLGTAGPAGPDCRFRPRTSCSNGSVSLAVGDLDRDQREQILRVETALRQGQ